MAYGDLSVFLPRAEGDKLNVEQARAEGETRASYLASMDQFNEELEENQRQFDITAALNDRHFEWMSGFEETKLAQELGLETTRLSQQKTHDEAMSSYYRNQLAMQTRESEYLMDYNTRKYELELEELRRANRGSGGGVGYGSHWSWGGGYGSSSSGGTGSGYQMGRTIGYKGPYS